MKSPSGEHRWPPVNAYYRPRMMAVELGYGAAAFLLSVHIFVLRLTPLLAHTPTARGAWNLTWLFVLSVGLNAWRFALHLRRGGPSNAAFALMLNWIGYVAGLSVQFVATNAGLLTP